MARRSLSPSEQRMLDILRRQRGPIKTTELVPLFFKGRDQPGYAQHIVMGVVRRLCELTKGNREVRVKRTARRGPRPVEVWVEGKDREAA
jgi:hypothetical protein